MHIVSKNKVMSFNIIGYQYPNYNVSSKDYNYDANWLICEIKYSEGDINEIYRDACLLTYKLEELIDSLNKILNNELDAYISEFMEPYLQFSITKAEDKVVFVIQFVYDTSDGNWKKRTVSTVTGSEGVIEILNKLVELQKIYPER